MSKVVGRKKINQTKIGKGGVMKKILFYLRGRSMEKVISLLLVFLAFSLPLFFGWSKSGNIELNKQLLLIVFSFLAFSLWLLKGLAENRVEIQLSPVHLFSLLFVSALLASTIFSEWPWGSFWGWPQEGSQNFITFLSLFLFYFTLAHILSKKSLLKTSKLLILSGLAGALIGALQLFEKFILPWQYTRAVEFNPMGGLNHWAVFLGSLIPVGLSIANQSKEKINRLLSYGAVFIFVFCLFMVNHEVAWLGLLTAMIVYLAFDLWKDRNKNLIFLAVPAVLFAVSLAFGVLGIRMPVMVQTPLDISPSWKATVEISQQMLKSSFKTLFLGWGPGSFRYGWSLFRGPDLNRTLFWNTRFSRGGSDFLEKIGSFGAIGGLIYFLLAPLVVWQAVKFENSSRPDTKDQASYGCLRAGLISSFAGLTVTKFFINHNTTLEFLWWFLLAGIVLLTTEKKKRFLIKDNFKAGFALSFLTIMMLTAGVFIFYLEAARYTAEIKYNSSLDPENSLEEIEKKLSRAVSLNPQQEMFWQDLSYFYLLKIELELESTEQEQEKISQNVSQYTAGAVASAKRATEINPGNVANWETRGYVYQQLIGLFQGAFDRSLDSYNQALALEPDNPYLLTELGKSYIIQAGLSEEQEDKDKYLDEAEQYMKTALELKPDYAPAAYQTAKIYELRGQALKAVEILEQLRDMEPYLTDYDPHRDIGLAFQLGVLYYNQPEVEDHLKKAEKELKRALELDPDYSNAIYFLGLVYDQQGKKDEAVEQFEKLAQLNPENEFISNILLNLKQGKPALTEQEVPDQLPIQEEPVQEGSVQKEIGD